jgi:hypothetical protein
LSIDSIVALIPGPAFLVKRGNSLGIFSPNLPSSMEVGAKVDPSVKIMLSNKKA